MPMLNRCLFSTAKAKDDAHDGVHETNAADVLLSMSNALKVAARLRRGRPRAESNIKELWKARYEPQPEP